MQPEMQECGEETMTLIEKGGKLTKGLREKCTLRFKL